MKLGTTDGWQFSPWKLNSVAMYIPKTAAPRMAGRVEEPTTQHQWLFHLLYITTQWGIVKIPIVWMKRLRIRLEAGVSQQQRCWPFGLRSSSWGNYPVHCGTFSSIPGLYPLDANSTPPVVMIKNVSTCCQMSPGGEKHRHRLSKFHNTAPRVRQRQDSNAGLSDSKGFS